MISRYAELTATLGLLPALLIEGEAPADAPRDVIAAAFEEALTALRLSPASVLSPAQQRSVAIRAVSRLMQQNAYREALRASLMGKPEVADAPAMVEMRLLALLTLGDKQGFEAEIDRYTSEGAEGRLRRHVMSILRNAHFQLGLADPLRRHDELWGPLMPSLTEKLEDLRRDPDRYVSVQPSLIENLYSLRPEGEMNRAEFGERLLWGMAVRNYVQYLGACHMAALRGEAGGPAVDSGVVKPLLQQAHALVRLPTNLDPLWRRLEEGRSIIMCAAHAGFAGRFLRFAPKLGVATVMIAKAQGHSTDNHLMISTSRPDFLQQLAKLAKLLRKETRLVGVLADGREGDLVEHDILARKVPIGRGAPVLAHLSNAAVFFTRSRWDGEGFMMDLMEGPAPSPGGGRDGFENEFFRFYAEGLRRILLGAPEDMAPQGGVFQSFV